MTTLEEVFMGLGEKAPGEDLGRFDGQVPWNYNGFIYYIYNMIQAHALLFFLSILFHQFPMVHIPANHEGQTLN